MELTLPAHPPFSLSAAVRSHGWCQLAPFAYDEQAINLGYVSRLASGQVVDLRIGEAPGGVRVEVDGPPGDGESPEIAGQVTWMLNLDLDLSGFYDLARQEPKLAHVEAKAQGRILLD